MPSHTFSRRELISPFIFALLAVEALPGQTPTPPVVDARVYDRAVNFLAENAVKFILNATVQVHWRAGARERLTYRKDLGDGRGTFIQVDVATGNCTGVLVK